VKSKVKSSILYGWVFVEGGEEEEEVVAEVAVL
jgi:hypothetical protein